MDNLTPDQARGLANLFLQVAQSIGDFELQKWDDFTPSQHTYFSYLHAKILRNAQDFLAFSTTLIMSSAEEDLHKLSEVVTLMTSTINKLQAVQKAIDIADAVVQLGGAIISRDPQAILNNIDKAFHLVA